MTDEHQDAYEHKLRLLERLMGPTIMDLINNEKRLVTDVWVNPDGECWAEEDNKRAPVGLTLRQEFVKQIINIAADLGGRVGNKYSPVIETRLPWGQRFEGIIPPVVNGAATFVIRVHRRQSFSLQSYLDSGRVDPLAMEFLDLALSSRMNTVICGTTGSGKTSLLDACLGHRTVANERVISIEETPELKLDHVRDKVRLIVDPRTRATDVVEEMRKLVRASLRMRPDRIIIGEVRGGEVIEWIKALYAGHAGGLMTLHADDPRDCMDRLEMLLAEAIKDVGAYRSALARVVERIVWMRRDKKVGWKVAGLYEVRGYDRERSAYRIQTIAGLPIDD